MSYASQGLSAGVSVYQQSASSARPSTSLAHDMPPKPGEPGVRLTLQEVKPSEPAYSSEYIPQQPADWAEDELSKTMQGNIAQDQSRSNPFRYLTGMLFDQVASGVDDIDQSLSRFRTYQRTGSYTDQWVGGVGSARSNSAAQSLSFTLTTRSGAEIRIDLASDRNGVHPREDSLAAMVSVNGTLSDEERAALGEMADLMERLTNEFMRTGKVSLEQLQGFDSSLFSELKLDFSDGINQYALTLNETDKERSLDINWNGNKVELTLDLKGNILVGSDAKTQALQHYLELIRDSVSKSNGSRDLADFMTDAFATLHRLGESDALAAAEQGKPLPDNTLLTGLQDFQAEFSSKISKPNGMAEKYFEREGFNLELGQKTRVEGQLPIDLTVEQEQHYSLSASFYRPLWMLERPDFDTQSYQYVEINEQSTRRTRQEYELGQWTSALQSEESSYEHRLTEYQLNEITRQDVKEDAWQKLSALTDEVQQKNDQKAYLALLDTLMITPPTKRSRV